MKRLALLMLLAACNPMQNTSQEIALGQEFSLTCCQTNAAKAKHTPHNLRLEFVALENDSRCPYNARCVWAGDAEVIVHISGEGVAPTGRVVLHTTLEPTKLRLGNAATQFELRLVNLQPAKGLPGDPSATFVLQRLP